MKYIEYGADRAETVILLHGGGLSWWNYRETAELLREEYRVILPILDGHAGSDRPFTAIEDNAEELIAWIDENLGGRAALIGGLSLGAQILLDMPSRRPELCRCAVVESASILPSAVTHALIAPTFGSSYGLIRNRRFAELQARSLHIRPELFEDYYRDTCRIEKADMIAFLQASTAYAAKDSLSACGAETRILVGEKENRAMRRSAELLHSRIPGSALTVLPGLYHGEFSLNHARDYAQLLRGCLRSAAEKGAEP